MKDGAPFSVFGYSSPISLNPSAIDCAAHISMFRPHMSLICFYRRLFFCHHKLASALYGVGVDPYAAERHVYKAGQEVSLKLVKPWSVLLCRSLF